MSLVWREGVCIALNFPNRTHAQVYTSFPLRASSGQIKHNNNVYSFHSWWIDIVLHCSANEIYLREMRNKNLFSALHNAPCTSYGNSWLPCVLTHWKGHKNKQILNCLSLFISTFHFYCSIDSYFFTKFIFINTIYHKQTSNGQKIS